ncbi:unnamed protein product, partial [Prorocentrum cordatum]
EGEDSDERDDAEDSWRALAALVEDEDGDEEGEEDDSEESDDAVRAALQGKAEPAQDGDEEASDEDEDSEEEEVSSLFSDDDLETYGGSELDPLDVECQSDESLDEGQSGDEVAVSKGGLLTSVFGGGSLHSQGQSCDEVALSKGGLLTAVFGGGSLHSEEKVRPGRPQKPRGQPSIKVVFPSMIWRGKDFLVVNKPADWICSASDVDKKKGRTLDPTLKVSVKGFKVLDDLLQYKFSDREKKCATPILPLMHDGDQKSYPNLFDEDGRELRALPPPGPRDERYCAGGPDADGAAADARVLPPALRPQAVPTTGIVTPREQTVDRNIEAVGQKAELKASGRRARTHVKVLAHFSRELSTGESEDYTLCTCEIAEGRMHQIRIHMSAALGAPIVSEFYYQRPRQMIEELTWVRRGARRHPSLGEAGGSRGGDFRWREGF